MSAPPLLESRCDCRIERHSMMLFYLAAQGVPLSQTPYGRCVRDETVKLERSGERPRDIAVAVVDVCHSKEPDYSPQLMKAVREQIEDAIVARVVQIRSERH
jgi:hypothetical protein